MKDGEGYKTNIGYNKKGDVPIIQSVAYAQYKAPKDDTGMNAVQRCVWGSWQFKGNGRKSNVLKEITKETGCSITTDGLVGEAYRFANFAYCALDSEGVLKLVEEEASSNVEIVANRSEVTYTVGPYKIDIENGGNNCISGTGNMLMRTLVNNEIAKDSGFCKGSFSLNIEFGSGAHKYEENKKFWLVYGDGSTSTAVDPSTSNPANVFPKLGEEFYVKFKVDRDDSVPTKFTAKAKIDYMKPFKGDVELYESSKVKYKMMTDHAHLFRSASSADAFSQWNIVETPLEHSGVDLAIDGKDAWTLATTNDHLTLIKDDENRKTKETDLMNKWISVKTGLETYMIEQRKNAWEKVSALTIDLALSKAGEEARLGILGLGY